MKTRRNVFGYPLLEEVLVLDQLRSVYTKCVLKAVHLLRVHLLSYLRDRKVQIPSTVATLGRLGFPASSLTEWRNFYEAYRSLLYVVLIYIWTTTHSFYNYRLSASNTFVLYEIAALLLLSGTLFRVMSDFCSVQTCYFIRLKILPFLCRRRFYKEKRYNVTFQWFMCCLKVYLHIKNNSFLKVNCSK